MDGRSFVDLLQVAPAAGAAGAAGSAAEMQVPTPPGSNLC